MPAELRTLALVAPKRKNLSATHVVIDFIDTTGLVFLTRWLRVVYIVS